MRGINQAKINAQLNIKLRYINNIPDDEYLDDLRFSAAAEGGPLNETGFGSVDCFNSDNGILLLVSPSACVFVLSDVCLVLDSVFAASLQKRKPTE